MFCYLLGVFPASFIHICDTQLYFVRPLCSSDKNQISISQLVSQCQHFFVFSADHLVCLK